MFRREYRSKGANSEMLAFGQRGNSTSYQPLADAVRACATACVEKSDSGDFRVQAR
jgi:hypothetical protein